MSTRGTTITPDIISSILLAAWQINTPKPERALRHLVNPTPPKDYRYLDAIAALCSLPPAPLPPPTLRKAMPAWISQMQAIKSSALKAHINSESAGSSDNNGPIGDFVADVYRICYEKLLESVRSYRAEDLLEEVSGSSDDDLVFLGLQVDERPLFVEGLTVLTGMEEQDIAVSSIEEILKLHGAARTVGKFRDHFPGTEYFVLAYRISEAVDFIVTFATAQDSQRTLRLRQDVEWIDVPSPREFIATMNTKEFMGPLLDAEESLLRVPDDLTELPEDMSKVLGEGSPDHVQGTGIAHCESALLQYILDYHLSVTPYIGVSQPTCYACLMLLRAFNRTFKAEFALGRRCATVDTAWLCPVMGAQLYGELVSSLQADLKVLCAKARADRASWTPLGII
ncbi:hypothetical protein V8D89_001376 [Ganoderma adspersum]